MNGNLKKWLMGAALTVATATSIAAWAMGPGGGMAHDPSRMIAHMSDKLNLSTEQQSGIESLLAQSKQASAADHARLRELRKEMMAQRDSFDAGVVRAQADEIGQITGRVVYQSAETWSQVYQLLDAEQKAELDNLMEQRKARRGKWGKGGGAPQ
jgi:Spy/CpxP family protein refolding chaperone